MRTYILAVLCLIATGSRANPADIPLEVQRLEKKAMTFKPPAKKARSAVRVHIATPPSNPSRYRLYPGSLKRNINQIAHQFGWPTVIWRPNYDYRWIGKARINSSNIKDLMRQILRHYPLQAIFYQGNHVLVITARNVS